MTTPSEAASALTRRLDDAAPGLARLDAYYRAKQPLSFLAPEVRAAAGDRLRPLAINWCRLIVSAVEERLDVEGFRFGRDAPVDGEAWDIWQANGLDEASQRAHAEALIHGRAYVIVWAGDDARTPRITVESARQVYVLHDPATGRRVAAVKRWVEDGYVFVTLYLPDEIHKLRSGSRVPEMAGVPVDGWRARGPVVPNPLGVVPVIPLVNRARLLDPDGESELEDAAPIVDAINKLATDLMVSAEFHAMPRRWGTGVELAEDASGVPVNPFSTVAGRTWLTEDTEAKFGQFDEASLDGYIHAIELLTQQLSSITAVPPHYLNILKGQLTSAESIRSAEASLVTKARRKQRAFGGAWEEAMRLAFLVRDGVPRAGGDAMETVWRDPETRTAAQAADAALKRKELGVPLEQLYEDLGYTPTQIARFGELRRREAALEAVSALLG